jgi:transposase
MKRCEKDEDGTYHEYEEKVVVYWSRKFYERERNEHRSFVEFLEKLEKNPAGFRVTKKEYGFVRKFLKKEVVNIKTGEVLNSNDLYNSIDKNKLEQFTAYMGYYQIVTSELESDPLEVIDKYHGLSRIEDQFRVMKSTLETRPLYVRTKEHIQAHLLICFIALVIIRIIQYKIRVMEGKDVTSCTDWDVGLSANRIQDSLNKWQTSLFPGGNYFFLKFKNAHNDLMKIHKAFGLDVRKGGFTYKELKEVKSQIKVF